MSFDESKSLEAENGFTVKKGAGLYSGAGSPIGFGSGVKLGSIYINSLTGDQYKKVGSTVNDWALQVFSDGSLGGVAASYVFNLGTGFGGKKANE